jgi:hypothetical protein
MMVLLQTMKDSLDNRPKSLALLLAFAFVVFAFIALPGFAVLYWVLDVGFAVALIGGSVLGMFGYYSLEGVLAAIGIAMRTWRKVKSQKTHTKDR